MKKLPNPIDKHVGSRVRMRRVLIGMSQERLGSALGLTFQQVQKYEKGTNRIGASRLQQIAGVLNVAAAYFFEDMPAGEGGAGGVILNVSDDGWFGRTAGPYQHLAQARLRAIEQGLPLIRAANTGISAIVDPYGRILEELPLGEAGVLDAFLPKNIPPTVFSEINRFIPASVAGLLLTAILILRYGIARRRKRSL